MCFGGVRDQYAEYKKPLQDKKRVNTIQQRKKGREQTDKNVGVEKPELEKRYQEVILKNKRKTAAQARSENAEAQAINENSAAENAEDEAGEVEGASTETMKNRCDRRDR